MSKTKWIWCNNDNNINEYAEFYGEFEYSQGEVSCILSCDGDYVLFVNGRYVNSNQYGDFERYKIFDSLSLTPYLRQGKNVFAVLVWHFGESTHRYVQYQPGLYFEVRDEKRNVVLRSDENIFARLSKAYLSHHTMQLSRQLGFSFLYDATAEDDWINGNGKDFQSATIREKKCSFYPRPTEKLHLAPLATAKPVVEQAKTRFLLDLGEEKVGLPYLRFYSSRPQKVRVSYGEYLLNGRVKAKFDAVTDFTFVYGAKEGENEYINYMLRLGCRYLEIFTEEPIVLEEIGIIPQYYPVKALPCSLTDELDKRIYALCQRTLELCMLEHYVDCPWREQGLYTFDARNQMLCGYHAFVGGNFKYARANLLLMAKDERADGLLSITFPCGTPLTIPAYSLHYIIALKEYIEYSGDISLVDEVQGKVRSLLDTFVKNMKGDVVCSFEGKDKWNFYDWTKYTKGTTGTKEGRPELILNALMMVGLQNFEWICKRANIPFGYEGLEERIRLASRRLFLREIVGLFATNEEEDDYVVLGNSLAILSGMATEEEAKDIAKKMSADELIACTLCMKPFFYDALLQVDEEKYTPRILKEIRKDYGKMLAEGATAAWETIDGYKALAGTGSLCHGWSAIPVYYYWKLSARGAL